MKLATSLLSTAFLLSGIAVETAFTHPEWGIGLFVAAAVCIVVAAAIAIRGKR